MPDSTSASVTPIPAPGLLAGSGQMAALVTAKDWSATPLGPIEQWPQSLRTTVSLCLASNFPISIAWGPGRVQIYNDGYWPLCGDKHPTSLGQDYKECWASAWEGLGEAFEQASAGQTRFLENQRMFLDRFGYLEETFFTFSFSPILDESGGVGGLFHPVTELTQQTLAERRLNILRTVAERTAGGDTEHETAIRLLETFRESAADLPFVALYSAAPGGEQALLEGQVGLDQAPALMPAAIDLAAGARASWPLAEAARVGIVQRVEQLATDFGTFTSGPYPEAPHTALVYPVQLGGAAQPAYFLVLGVSARRALDAEYALFFDLLVGATTTALAKARTLAEERQRAEALAALDRARTVFFSNISHEFRTPLTLMLGPLEDALTDDAHPLPAFQHERLTLVQRNTLRLQRLVNNLLDFSRLEAGRLQADFAPLNLAAYTAELAGVFRAALEKAGLTLTVDCPRLSAPVYVDAGMWEKVVFNLLSNALKFTFTGGIRVGVSEEDGQAVLRVTDTGEGISATELPKLFTRFYRTEGMKSRSHEGSGIGLAFVQELVQLHGGEITAESQAGQGSTFTVRLPLGQAHLPAERVRTGRPEAPQPGPGTAFVAEAQLWLAETPKLPAAPGTTPAAEPADEAAATILVVDDNADMRSYVQRILARQPQWTVHTAADGLQALDSVARQRPDLVISDVMMPHLDGFGLLQALKQNPDTARIPVVLLSARAGEEATVEGLDQGADDYLVKPFAARELLARVRTQLDITRTRQDNTRLQAAEEELRKFKVLSDHAFDAFILMRADGSFAYLNELARQRWGYTAAETAQLRVPDVDPIYQEEKYRQAFAQAQLGPLPTFETLHRRKDGSTYPVEISMGGLTLDGQPHMFAVARDITAQKASTQALHESEQRFRILADVAPNIVWAVNPDSSIRYINQAFVDFVGVTPAQYEATGWGPYMHPDELETAQRTLTEAIDSRTRYTLEHRMRRHDGQYRWLLAQGAPSYFPNGELYGYVGSAIDITELKETNEQLVRTNRDLDNFVYTASHDLKAPISNIEGLLRLLEDLLPAELRTNDILLPVLARMQDAVERFTRTIAHLTDVSKLQLEFAHPAAPTELLPLIEDVRLDLLPLLAQSGGRLEVDVAECPTLLLAAKNLRSMLYNLVSNGLKYHHPDRLPVVRLSCRREGDFCVLRVQDNGLGLSEGQQAKLFGLFERLHTHVEGTGVGLYMVKKMVENAGGTISVQSREGEGSTFAMWFPVQGM
ncbi:two-component system sensor histidine kinase/response regulator [Hymenobacter amundsenii]|uniref:histidine kinase n=1 Tax=Hymenobacter amundsenii TaxID=2006685 RepID=A0A246FQR9_9BACT|nr:ATP-binding protein [Hymenobacter amundsenii]OWP65082.1 two-component system sensor histidine kinase/response regulator [Hymenobacter amundsenii]